MSQDNKTKEGILLRRIAKLEMDLDGTLFSAEKAQEEAASLGIELDRIAALLASRDKDLLTLRCEIEQRDRMISSLLAQQERQSAVEAGMSAEFTVLVEELTALVQELEASNTQLVRANEDLEKRIAERTVAIQESERRLSMAQHYAGVGTWDWDAESGQVSWSKGYYDLMGVDPASATPSREQWLNLIHPQDREHAN